MVKEFDWVDQYSTDAPPSHQCGYRAQSVHTIDKLKNVVLGGEMDEEGKATIIYLSYTDGFALGAQAMQELSCIVQATTNSKTKAGYATSNYIESWIRVVLWILDQQIKLVILMRIGFFF